MLIIQPIWTPRAGSGTVISAIVVGGSVSSERSAATATPRTATVPPDSDSRTTRSRPMRTGAVAGLRAYRVKSQPQSSVPSPLSHAIPN